MLVARASPRRLSEALFVFFVAAGLLGVALCSALVVVAVEATAPALPQVSVFVLLYQ